MAPKRRFAPDLATHAVKFFEGLLVHTKGGWARKPFILAEFQHEIIEPLFGQQVYDSDLKDWVRLYNLAWLELARKNGKSELMAGIALLLTGGDDEEGAEIYGVARDTDQASLVFNVARRMVELSPVLSQNFKLYPTNRRIVYPKTSSFYRVIASDALGNLGQDPHGILFDEVIAQPNAELWDALKTGFGSRRQPLMVAATTAGDDPGSFAKSEHDFSVRVAEDPKLDPRRFVYIRSTPRNADLADQETWKLANPAIEAGFLRPQVLRDEYQTAISNPREERRFRQFRLNQWQDSPSLEWIGLHEWDQTAGMVVEEQLKGKTCYGGLVAATAQGITALAYVFPAASPQPWQCVWRFFLPEDSLPDLVSRTNNAAEQWVKQGKLKLTEGEQIDVEAHIAQIQADLKLYDIRQLAHVPGVIGIIQPLMAERPNLPVQIGPQAAGSALLDWEQLIRAQRFVHGSNPVARWMLGNTFVKESVSGTLRIDRRGSADDVSGIVAAEIAMRRALLSPIAAQWDYEAEGLIVF